MRWVFSFVFVGCALLLAGCGDTPKPTEPAPAPPPPKKEEPKPEPKPESEPPPPPKKKPEEKKPEEKKPPSVGTPEEIQNATVAWVKAGAEYSSAKDELRKRVRTFEFGEVSEKQLKALPDMPTPFGLVFKAQVTAAGLDNLKRFYFLTELDLSETGMGDGTAFGLRQLEGLTVLNLNSTHVSDGLKHLKGLQKLKTLDLGSASEVSDAGLKELAPLKHLTVLKLYSTKVTDAGMKDLKPLANLTHLDLSDTALTDLGLKELKELKNLTSLNVKKTAVTEAGVKDFKDALPKCTVIEK